MLVNDFKAEHSGKVINKEQNRLKSKPVYIKQTDFITFFYRLICGVHVSTCFFFLEMQS